MSRVNSLRKIVYSKLADKDFVQAQGLKGTYYEVAKESALYPHIVYSISGSNNDDLTRKDMTIDIDIWDKSTEATRVLDISDEVEDMFNNVNLPQSDILPTFFLIDSKTVPDEDKKIRHRLVRVLVQNYEREE